MYRYMNTRPLSIWMVACVKEFLTDGSFFWPSILKSHCPVRVVAASSRVFPESERRLSPALDYFHWENEAPSVFRAQGDDVIAIRFAIINPLVFPVFRPPKVHYPATPTDPEDGLDLNPVEGSSRIREQIVSGFCSVGQRDGPTKLKELCHR